MEFRCHSSLSLSAVFLIPLPIKCSSLAFVPPARAIAVSQQISENPRRASLHRRNSRPSCFYLANKGLFSLIVHKHRGKKSPSYLARRGYLNCFTSVSYVRFPDIREECVHGAMWAISPCTRPEGCAQEMRISSLCS